MAVQERLLRPRFFASFVHDSESRVVKEFAKEKSLVIATGGGSILREENRDAMMQNSLIVYLDRELCKLATDGRPLSGNMDKMQKLYETRYPIYVNLADVHLKVEEDNIDGLADAIIKSF